MRLFTMVVNGTKKQDNGNYLQAQQNSTTMRSWIISVILIFYLKANRNYEKKKLKRLHCRLNKGYIHRYLYIIQRIKAWNWKSFFIKLCVFHFILFSFFCSFFLLFLISFSRNVMFSLWFYVGIYYTLL